MLDSLLKHIDNDAVDMAVEVEWDEATKVSSPKKRI